MKANVAIGLVVYACGIALIYYLAERNCRIDAMYAIIIATLKIIGLL